MDIKARLSEIYNLYASGKYSEAYSNIEEILREDPNNSYALRYKDLILPHLNKNSEVGKIATVKAKNLKCPHCQASIAMSALNEEQKTKIRDNNYSDLNIKCPYCHTDFTLQKKSADSIIGINLGDKINYKNKSYTVVGSVLYEGKWYESYYSGFLQYLEWILLGQDNSYLYFSEGYFLDDGAKKYEFEFSEKVIPTFEVYLDVSNNLMIDGVKHNVKEKNTVTAKKIYGENSKVFKVGEEVELFNFSYIGKNYILEKESAGAQKEAGIYLSEDVSNYEAARIFGKSLNNSYNSANNLPNIGLSRTSWIWFTVIAAALYEYIGYILGFFATIFFIYSLFKPSFIENNKKKYIFLILPGFCLLTIPWLLGLVFDENKEIKLENIDESQKYKIEFTNQDLISPELTSTTTYDYGGTRYYYQEKTGLKFSVIDEYDKEIIEKIIKKDNISSEVQKVFSEKIYKLK